MQYWQLLITYLQKQKMKVALLAILLFASIGLRLVNPQIVRYFIDTARDGGTTDQLTRTALLFVGVVLILQVVTVGMGYLSELVGWTATNQMRVDLADHCLRLDMTFHNTHTPGEMIERIDGDIETLANFFSLLTLQVVGSGLMIISTLIVLFGEDWRVGFGLLAFTVLVLIYLYYLLPLIRPPAEASRQVKAEVSSFLEERLAGTEDIGANGAHNYIIQRLYDLFGHMRNAQRKVSMIHAAILGGVWVMLALFSATGLAIGAILFQRDLITLGTVYLIFSYTGLISWPLFQIFINGDDLQRASASVSRVQELFQQQSRLKPGMVTKMPTAAPDQGTASTLEFHNVTFAYNAKQPVLQELSFTLKRGQVLGLLGRTGSGKTTIARLLLRLYEPTVGQIRVNDLDIGQIRLTDLRQQIGLVTQDVQLFQATVRDNLAFFDPAITDAQIWEALEALDLAAWAKALPQGLDSMLASGSGGLSAGEAQLLAFARVFLKNPGLIILDEASSRLDPATEQHLEYAITTLLEGRTAVIIAHRLSTVQRTDQIMVLANGQILEHGDRVRLAQDSTSYFHKLLKSDLNVMTN